MDSIRLNNEHQQCVIRSLEHYLHRSWTLHPKLCGIGGTQVVSFCYTAKEILLWRICWQIWTDYPSWPVSVGWEIQKIGECWGKILWLGTTPGWRWYVLLLGMNCLIRVIVITFVLVVAILWNCKCFFNNCFFISDSSQMCPWNFLSINQPWFLSIGQQEGINIGNITVMTVTIADSSSSCTYVDQHHFF